MTISNEQIAAFLVENPEAKLVPMISSDCWNEDFHWTMGKITKIEVDEIYEVDERLYLSSKDKEELELDLAEQAINLLASQGISFKDDAVYEKTLTDLENKVVWQKAIILYIE